MIAFMIVIIDELLKLFLQFTEKVIIFQ